MQNENSELKDFKSVIRDWLSEWYEDAKQKDSKMQFSLNTAYKSVSNSQDPIYSGRDAKKLKGIGDALSGRIDKKIGQWYKDNNIERPFVVENVVVNPASTRPKKPYNPKYRSCAFGIIVGMYKSTQTNFTRRDIMDECQIYTDTPIDSKMNNVASVSAKSTAGSSLATSLKTLITKELIESYGRPAKFSLTPLGLEVAEKLSDNLDKMNLQRNGLAAPENRIEPNLPPVVNNSKMTDKKQPVRNTTDVPVIVPVETIDLSTSFYTPSFNPIQKDIIFIDNDPIITSNANNNAIIDLCSSSIVEETILIDKNDDFPTASQQSDTFELRNDLSILSMDNIPLSVLNEYNIKLIIDNRENLGGLKLDALESKCYKLGIKMELAPLRLGDALWVAESLDGSIQIVLDYLIERKTTPDLIASIKDHRYLEQKNRLKAMQMTVFYLLEESPKDQIERDRFGEEGLETAFCQILDEGFVPLRTNGPQHTISYFVKLTAQIKEKYGGKPLFYVQARHVADKEFYNKMSEYYVVEHTQQAWLSRNESINTKMTTSGSKEWKLTFDAFQGVVDKSEHIMARDMSELMLTSIKGITPIKASVLIDRFKTLRGLYEEIKKTGDPKRLFTSDYLVHAIDDKLMDGYTVTFGQIAKKFNYLPTRLVLGPVVSQRLIDFMEACS